MPAAPRHNDSPAQKATPSAERVPTVNVAEECKKTAVVAVVAAVVFAVAACAAYVAVVVVVAVVHAAVVKTADDLADWSGSVGAQTKTSPDVLAILEWQRALQQRLHCNFQQRLSMRRVICQKKCQFLGLSWNVPAPAARPAFATCSVTPNPSLSRSQMAQNLGTISLEAPLKMGVRPKASPERRKRLA